MAADAPGTSRIAAPPAISVTQAASSASASGSGEPGLVAGMRRLHMRHSSAGDVDSSDNESPMSQPDTPKETESPRFQALLRMTAGGRVKPVKDIKSFSHELDPKGVRLNDYWKPHSTNDLEEILVTLRARFNSVKLEVDSELHAFAADLVEVLESAECGDPHAQECVEDLLVLAQKCATMSPADFRQHCEAIVQEVDDRRQELPIGMLKQLHTRMLFILTRCTRLLQFEKQNGLDGNGTPEKACLDRAWAVNRCGRASFNDRRVVFAHQRLADGFRHASMAQGNSSRSSASLMEVQDRGLGSDQESALDASPGARQGGSWKSALPTTEQGSRGGAAIPAPAPQLPRKDTKVIETSGCASIQLEMQDKELSVQCHLSTGIDMHTAGPSERVAWGYGSDHLEDSSLVICRICEDHVPSVCLEVHSRICAYADRCDHKTLSTDERLLRLAELLDRLSDFHTTACSQIAASGRVDESQALLPVDPRLNPYFKESQEPATHLEEPPHSLNRQQMYPSCSSVSSLTRVTSQSDLSMVGRIPLVASENVMQINELADIARCVGNAKIADGGAFEYLESCMQDLEEILQQNTAAALTVYTFGRRIQKLVREKLLTASDGAEFSSSDEIEYEDDAFRSTPVHPAYKDRTTIDDFEIIKAISRGAFGRVFLARKRTTGDLFAIKVLRKSDMMRKNAVESVQAERNILISVRNPFVVRFFYSFTCKDNLYLVMEYLNGGDLYSLLRNLGCLEEDMARVYIAELVLALEYLHSLGVVHRDLKPDNLLIAHDGHIKLTDFGLSRVGLLNSTEDLSGPAASTSKLADEINHPAKAAAQRSAVGTPDYLAPEILLGTGHGYTADWWSTGVILFEFLTGMPPFNAEHPQIIFDNILNRNIPWPSVPEYMSVEAQDLLERLLTWDPHNRLGANGAREVKAHPFFKDINWDTLSRQKAAFIPSPDSAHDTSYFTSRHMWNPAEGMDHEIGDSSDCGSSIGGSSTSGQEDDQGDEYREGADIDITPSVRDSFSNFSYKCLSQLAAINYEVVSQTGPGFDQKMKEL